MSAQCGSASTCVAQRTDARVGAKARCWSIMTLNSQQCVEENFTFVGLAGKAHVLAHEHAIVDAENASNALHPHITFAMVSDALILDVGHGKGHQAFNVWGLMACRDVSNLQSEPQARAGWIILDLPPFVERAPNAPSPAALVPGRSDEPVFSVSQWPR